jgi:hypothetical protein
MAEMIRHCPDCGWDSRFEQLHAEPGGCPDAPDGYCPEWYCTTCGTALLIGIIPVRCADARPRADAGLPGRAALRDRVA